MSGILTRALSRVFFWNFERGSWQYDILCGLILCFIFLTPKTVFDGSLFTKSEKPSEQLEDVPQQERTQLQPFLIR